VTDAIVQANKKPGATEDAVRRLGDSAVDLAQPVKAIVPSASSAATSTDGMLGRAELALSVVIAPCPTSNARSHGRV
jgi:hypothetical protein